MLLVLFLFSALFVTHGQGQPSETEFSTLVAINAEGATYTDSDGITWEYDLPYVTGGFTYSVDNGTDIIGTENDALYQIMRVGPSTYNIPLPNAEYKLRLHFAELWPVAAGSGLRVFGVEVQDELVYQDLDVYNETGGLYISLVLESNFTVTNGNLKVEFLPSVQNPMVSGLEVLAPSSLLEELFAPSQEPSALPSSVPSTLVPTVTPQPSQSAAPSETIRTLFSINAAGDVFTFDGVTWEDDSPYASGGGEFIVGSEIEITGTENDALYQSMRFGYGFMAYNIPLPNGEYMLRLHFAELWVGASAPGARVFGIEVQDELVYQDLDVYNETGGRFISLVLESNFTVTNGNLKVEFLPSIQNPIVSGLEVYASSSYLEQLFAPSQEPSELPSSVPTLSSVPTITPQPSQSVAPTETAYTTLFSINAGGNSFTWNGVTWQVDLAFLEDGVSIYTVDNETDIIGTENDALYQNMRAGTTTWNIPLANGEYKLRLHFAELWPGAGGPGKRVFDIAVQNETVYQDLDIFDMTGELYSSLVLEREATVTDGILKIELLAVADNPIISGLEVLAPSLWLEGLFAPCKVEGPFETPLVPVAGAMLPNGKALVWSAFATDTFKGPGGATSTAMFDPSTGEATYAFVEETGHDMFCPGTTFLGDGRIMVTGGTNSKKTSFYDPNTGHWTSGQEMSIGRGYQVNVILSDNSVFTLGGSFSGGRGGKYGEVWTEGSGWEKKLGIMPEHGSSLNTNDTEGVYRSDNHMWLFEAPNGRIFHAGPAKRMHWIDLAGNGSVTESLLRGDDKDRICGNALLYDVGKIFTVGGAEDYSPKTEGSKYKGVASKRAYVIDITGSEANVTRVGDMTWGRSFCNSVVLPSGEIVVIGGQRQAQIFTDFDAVMTPEIWNPETGNFTLLNQSIIEPRTYHSIALLMKDGRVIYGGGGLPTVNHFSLEILTPPYLLDADGNLATRPVIISSPVTFELGGTINVIMDTVGSHTFAFVRLGAVTHAVNLDQRRIPLEVVSESSGTFTLSIPSNPHAVPPGTYLLFAMNSDGVPSEGENIQRADYYVSEKPSLAPSFSAMPSSSPSLSLEPTVTARPTQTMAPTDPDVHIYINAGGGTFTFDGVTWENDTAYVLGGGNYTKIGQEIVGTENDALYQSERNGPSTYIIPLENGDYTLRLHFAEIFFQIDTPGERLFDVEVQDVLVYEDLDIFNETGALYAALVLERKVTVTDGYLKVELFTGSAQKPKISGLEVHTYASPAPSMFLSSPAPTQPEAPSSMPTESLAPAASVPPTHLYINSGGNSFTIDGVTWEGDTPYVLGAGGRKFSRNEQEIDRTDNDALYQSERNGALTYNIPLVNGEYTLRLHFAEIYGKIDTAGKRMFDVEVQDVLIYEDLDIYNKTGGPYTALVLERKVTVTDGYLKVELITGSAQKPKISGLEVHTYASPAPSIFQSSPAPTQPEAPSSLQRGRLSPTVSPPGTSVYINAGGNSFTIDGVTWEGDTQYVLGGRKFSRDGQGIDRTNNEALYQSERNGALTYNIPLVDGEYTLRLHFAEIYGKIDKAGKRMFDVEVQDVLIYEDLDIYKKTGGLYTALVLERQVTVTDGNLKVELLTGSAQKPKISGLEIHSI